MIELLDDTLTFRFPGIHKEAECSIDFQRTLRIPDDNREYPLPPGLGEFPVQHVDDFAAHLPEAWERHGGVFIPMYQSEALWINFSGHYPCAVKIAAGKINAVSGDAWREGLSSNPQDYLVVPDQPWLDGFNVTDDLIRQFVAMPLGEGYTAEEQMTGKAEHGGLQIIVYPMKPAVYMKHFAWAMDAMERRVDHCLSAPDMGLAPGGLMRQEIYEDKYGIDAWDQDHGLRCYVHLANSEQYQAITGHNPPHQPPTAKNYTQAGLPWFDYYGDGEALGGSDALSKLTSVAAKFIEKSKSVLPGNDPVQTKNVKKLGKSNVVRCGKF